MLPCGMHALWALFAYHCSGVDCVMCLVPSGVLCVMRLALDIERVFFFCMHLQKFSNVCIYLFAVYAAAALAMSYVHLCFVCSLI